MDGRKSTKHRHPKGGTERGRGGPIKMHMKMPHGNAAKPEATLDIMLDFERKGREGRESKISGWSKHKGKELWKCDEAFCSFCATMCL